MKKPINVVHITGDNAWFALSALENVIKEFQQEGSPGIETIAMAIATTDGCLRIYGLGPNGDALDVAMAFDAGSIMLKKQYYSFG